MTDHSALLIGAGHNGLVCAAYQAKPGYKVTVQEAADRVGGAAITREFDPGYKVSDGAQFLYLLDPEIRSELKLDQHGLGMAKTGLETIALAEDGNWLAMKDGHLDGPGANGEDQAAMHEYHRRMSRFAGIIGSLHDRIPPRMGTSERKDLLALAKVGWSIRRLGRDDMREFLRIAGINVYDVLQEQFSSELLKGALSLDGTLGTFLGTRSNNSVFCALHRLSRGGAYALPAGGMGAVSEALAAAARAAGAEIRLGSPVQRITMDFDRASGVELESGEVLNAGCVISGADPHTTFQKLLGVRHVEAGFANRVRNLRAKGNVAKLHLALDGLPQFSGLDARQAGERLLVAPSLQYVEHAFNHAKYGEYSDEPTLEISIPSEH
jgi:phytoene dehydrogenase-like protein